MSIDGVNMAGFQPVDTIREDTGDSSFYNILSRQQPGEGCSIGAISCRTPVRDATTFFVARNEPAGTLLVIGKHHFWSSTFEPERNAQLASSGVLPVAARPAATLMRG